MSQIYLIIVLVITAISFVVSGFLFFRLRQMEKKLKLFFSGSEAKDLENVLMDQVEKINKLQADAIELRKFHESLRQMAESSVQKVGMVRYNAFGESGGDQSFAVAFLDAHDDGVVISSIFGRGGFRAYAKPIEKGESKYQLMEEEIKALEKAGMKA